MADSVTLRKVVAPGRLGTAVVELGALPLETQKAVTAALGKTNADALFKAEIQALTQDGGPYPSVSTDSPPEVVADLKLQLARAGFNLGALQGPGSEVFGPETQAAVQTFQLAHNLPANKSVGAETWAELKQQRFSLLSPESQVMLIAQLSKHSNDAEARSVIQSVALSAGFRALTAVQQRRLLLKIGSAEPLFGGALRRTIRDHSYFRVALREYLPERQTTALKKLADESSPPVLDTQYIPTLLDDSKGKYRVSGPSTSYLHKFVSGRSLTAHKYEIATGGARVPVFVSPALAKNGLKTLSIEQIAQGLSTLPRASLDLVKGINLEGQANQHDAAWAHQYETGSFKSYMTAGSNGVINIFPSDAHDMNALNEVLVHEIGHILSHGAWGYGETAGWAAWKRAAEKDAVVVSQYAEKSPEEDFAEVFVAYVAVKGTPQETDLRATMPARFALIDQLLLQKNIGQSREAWERTPTADTAPSRSRKLQYQSTGPWQPKVA